MNCVCSHAKSAHRKYKNRNKPQECNKCFCWKYVEATYHKEYHLVHVEPVHCPECNKGVGMLTARTSKDLELPPRRSHGCFACGSQVLI